MRIGIDWGGTKIEAIALSDAGAVLARKRIATPQHDYDACIAAASGLVREIETALGQTGTVGIGIPGAISTATGLVKNANSVWLNGRPLDTDMAQALCRPVRVESDGRTPLRRPVRPASPRGPPPARRWRPSGSKPSWARCCSNASCWMPRSLPWRPTVLWPAGGRGDEPDPLALKWPALWPGPCVPGLARIRATIYRHLSSSRPEPPRRPGPVGPMPDAALLEAIRAVLGASPFHGEGHRKVWARLRVAGVLLPFQRAQRPRPTRKRGGCGGCGSGRWKIRGSGRRRDPRRC